MAKGGNLKPYFFITPTLIVLFLIYVYPIIFTFEGSLYRWRLDEIEKPFIGIQNYQEFFSNPLSSRALINTFLFTLFSVSLSFLLGLAIALYLAYRIRNQFLRIIVTLPYMVPPVVGALAWRCLLFPGFSHVNYYLGLIGVPEIFWLSETYGIFSLVIIDVWYSTPFIFLLLLSGIESLPVEPFEVAKIDGASSFQLFRYIILPLLMPFIIFALFFRTIIALRTFTIFYLVIGPTGGAGGYAMNLPLFISYSVWKLLDMSKGLAASFILILISLIIGSIWIMFFRRSLKT